jgi:hypothetical protein
MEESEMTMDIEKEVLVERMKDVSDLIFSSIAEHYETGNIDDPHSNHLFMNLLACICEKKIEGSLGEDGMIKWTLTKEFREQLEEDKLVTNSENVIRGPW